MLMKSVVFALLLAACAGETTNTEQTVSPPPPRVPIPEDVLPPILREAAESQNAKRLNAASVTLPDGTIVTHEYCTTLSGDAKDDCTALLDALGLCAEKADEPRAKCEAANIRDYLIMTNDDDDNDDNNDEYPSVSQ